MKYTILINKENEWKEKYKEKYSLINTTNINNENIKIEEETYNNYLKLKDYLKSINIEIGITDSYRSIEEQDKLFKELSNNYVAKPYQSEHHTGLSIDITIKKNNKYIDEETEETKEDYKLIHSILHKYGFILRYPKEKENITGYPYEPWHIRYVGKIPSSIIYKENLTLEEYLKDYTTILYLNKPKDITSFDVVNEISNLFGIKRVGHTGTLDPLATGVLIVLIGKATKIAEISTSEYKEYIAEVELGYQTDTYDNTGVIINRKEVSNINLEEVINSYKKTYLQEVPIYSAVKVNGKKLYEYARNNEKVTLPKKEVTIKEIELLEHNNNYFKIRTLVSKGCYIRSLINDIGLSLNTYATMTNLIRTKQGNISIENTNTLEDIKNNNYNSHTIEELLNYQTIIVEDDLLKKISNGVTIPNTWNIKDKVIFKTKNNKILGIICKY